MRHVSTTLGLRGFWRLPEAGLKPSNPSLYPVKERRAGLPLRKIEWLLLGVLIVAAFAVCVYHLGGLPDTMLADEADNGQSAVRILYGLAPRNGIFGLDWTSQPALSIYKEAAFAAIFGFNLMAFRLPSAVMNTLALIPFYILLRRQFSVLPSYLATLLLATSVWYLNFSRSGWNCGDVCFYMLGAMLCIALALDNLADGVGVRWRRWSAFAAAGFFCALGLYAYPSGRAVTVAAAAFLPVAMRLKRSQRTVLIAGYLLLFGVEAATFAPQAVYIARNWDWFNGRAKVVLILNDPGYKADPFGTMARQLSRNVRGPWDGRVNNTAQYSPVGEPQLDRVTGLLVASGMVLTLLRRRLRSRPETWLWWLMLLSGWGLTQLTTVGTPNGARGIGYMPTLIYFAAVTLDEVVALLATAPARARSLSVARWLAVGALTAAILFTGVANVKHYVDWQKKPRTRQDRYLYVTAQEFPIWAADVVERARRKAGMSNVGSWRESHPIHSPADPYGETEPSR